MLQRQAANCGMRPINNAFHVSCRSVTAHQLEGDGAWIMAVVHGRTAAEIARCHHHSSAFQPPAELRLPAPPPTGSRYSAVEYSTHGNFQLALLHYSYRGVLLRIWEMTLDHVFDKVASKITSIIYRFTSCNYPSSGRSFVSVRQVSLSRSVPGVSLFCHSRTHTWMTLTLTLTETLPGWTWVRVASLVSIGPAVWPAIRNIDTDRQTDRQT